jgi:acyl-CoA synthetase (AMP-forming)/AMP-acid ligase II
MIPSMEAVRAQLTAPGEFFEMEEVEIRGIPTRTWKNAPPNLRTVLENSRNHGDAVFLVYEDERITFAEHYQRVAALANLAHAHGVTKGERVAIAMRNYPEWSIAFWAAAALGAVIVPLNAWWTGEELEYGLADSGSVVLIADEERAARIREHRPNLPDLRAVLVARPSGPLADGELDFADAIAGAGLDVELPPADVHPDDDATIFYTSGTTGRPKGALGTQRNICTNLMSLLYSRARGQLRSESEPAAPAGVQSASLLTVPLFHATGCHSILLTSTAFGGKLVMIYKWDPERALELIERERITSFGGVPSMVLQALESPSFKTRDLSSLQSVSYGGAPAPPELVRRIEEEFPPVSPGNGYGLTETSSVATYNAADDYRRKPDSVGAPVAVVDVKVVDDQGNELPVGELGELWIKGPNVVKGYWNKPEATAEAFTDGWLQSGDIARIDDEGFVYIVDRAKDMVIRGGENVYCVEVESVLHDHPDVIDAAVIGVPHPTLGEEVGAVVQLRPGATATAEDLQTHVRARLAGFKVPAHIWFRDEELPRSPQGKIQKRQLREELAP